MKRLKPAKSLFQNGWLGRPARSGWRLADRNRTTSPMRAGRDRCVRPRLPSHPAGRRAAQARCVFSAPTRIAAGARDLSRRNVSIAEPRSQKSNAATLRSMRARASTERSNPATAAALSLGSTATEDASLAHQHPCGLKSAPLRSRGDPAKHIPDQWPVLPKSQASLRLGESRHGGIASAPRCVQEWGGDGLVLASCQQHGVLRGRAVPAPCWLIFLNSPWRPLTATIAPDKNAGPGSWHSYPWTARLRPCREGW